MAVSLVVDLIADSAHQRDDWDRMVKSLNREVTNDAMEAMMEVRRAPDAKGWRIYKGKYLEKEEDT
jgi:hypothetical protein